MNTNRETTIMNMVTLVWHIIRDYHARTYSLKYVCNVAKNKLENEGHSVTVGTKGKMIIDGIPYRIFKEHEWNSYDVMNVEE